MSGAAEVGLPRLGFCRGDEVLDARGVRQPRICDDDVRRLSDDHDGIETIDRIVTRLSVICGIDGEADVAEAKRVAVRRSARHDFGADERRRAGPVIDHHGLPQLRRQFLADEAPDVGVSAPHSDRTGRGPAAVAVARVTSSRKALRARRKRCPSWHDAGRLQARTGRSSPRAGSRVSRVLISIFRLSVVSGATQREYQVLFRVIDRDDRRNQSSSNYLTSKEHSHCLRPDAPIELPQSQHQSHANLTQKKQKGLESIDSSP